MLPTSTHRIASIDIFRGLTIMVMIFVNDLAGVHGLPWWTYHAHAEQDLMTYVDMVFPFFLFIVGMSMPLAIAQRLKKNPSMPSLCWHVFSRSAGLVILGLILANAEKADPKRMPIDSNLWALVGLFGAILFWLVPSRDPPRAAVYRVLRFIGLALLIVTYALFRRTTADGHAAWIDGSYPEILGLIGYTYFASAVLYLLTRRWQWASFAWFLLLTASCAILTATHTRVHLPLYVWPFESGAMASITMAGIVVSTIFFGTHKWQSIRARTQLASAFAVAAILAAWLLTPLGISKIRATPTWCLYSIGAATLIFAALYWLCDVLRKRTWAAFVHPAGENTLLTNLLPDLYYYLTTLIGFTYLDTHFNTGAPGVLRAVFFTLLMLAIAALLTRARVRLQL